MNKLNLKPSHKSIKDYYTALEQFHKLGISNEGAVRSAFQSLLDVCGRQFQWKLAPEWQIRQPGGNIIRVDGALVDTFKLTHGFWEAKDTQDKLEREIKKKFEQGYPKNNIIFQEPERAIVYQDGNQILDEDITRDVVLVEVLKLFFAYQPPEYTEWEEAVTAFKDRIPELAARLVELIEQERRTNKSFINTFSGFMELCKQSINPNLSEKAVEEMLIQHLLTERIFSKVFDNPDFAQKNVIAAEIEKVVNALVSQTFNKAEFMKNLSHFYGALEKAASTISDFTHKQHFLNTVYEKFFQGFSVKVADTHGIVYTPQPIVNFMVKSVEDILKKEFGKSLSDKGVHILDPFVGTGNFIVRIMQEINKTDLSYKYEHELHCNEVMLLPYYIASMNIEHEYYERTGKYKPFEGICLVDTFELAEEKQQSLFTQENTERVAKQKETPIFVIIANPPYNANQLNENDNNKNRKYKAMEKRVSETYGKDSKATLLNKLHDPYVKAIRWASDRIGNEGIVAFVTNNGFIDNTAFDGMRKHLSEEFDSIYILDLGGNVRKNPKLSGTTHNVFGIQVGVSINLFVKKSNKQKAKSASIYYSRVDEFSKKEDKYHYLDKSKDRSIIKWKSIKQDKNYNWLTEGMHEVYETFIPLGTKETKAHRIKTFDSIFENYGLGVGTNRDVWAFNFKKDNLIKNIDHTVNIYNDHVIRWKHVSEKYSNIDDFVENDETKISWTGRLKNYILSGKVIQFNATNVRHSLYRPFTHSFLYFDHFLNERRYQFPYFLPKSINEKENRIICVSGIGSLKLFQILIVSLIPSLDLLEKTQCFPFYTYDNDGTNRMENITDWALEQFRSHYKNNKISKWDIFYYVYGILHHPKYREQYAANLRRELPRIPFAPDFFTFAHAGEKLADLHINYEKQEEYPLEKIENPDTPLNWRVEKMRLSKDKSSIIYNDFLTLGGIPPEAFEYRLGNRSALEWIIDQYQIKTDKRSGIVNDPNSDDDEQYIVRLIGQVIKVSLKTVEIVESLPELGVPT